MLSKAPQPGVIVIPQHLPAIRQLPARVVDQPLRLTVIGYKRVDCAPEVLRRVFVVIAVASIVENVFAEGLRRLAAGKVGAAPEFAAQIVRVIFHLQQEPSKVVAKGRPIKRIIAEVADDAEEPVGVRVHNRPALVLHGRQSIPPTCHGLCG
ncbi:MAG: hypothetical protein C7B45_03510 [Sulfobacillus acidophilus]|uniref:Uncharacterized protein n=1 Tax=Sulfobacillus acidophilus TaxID=53633 RepID=A0A2T2WMC8_9FIRM|nr:MAG: hypothetical protein C7B45_03510 [Sulfobacillus acidophilus]